jgi:hypothetical protein
MCDGGEVNGPYSPPLYRGGPLLLPIAPAQSPGPLRHDAHRHAALRARRVDAEAPASRPLAALAGGLFVGIEVGAIYWVANLL